MKSHKDLDVWKLGMELSVGIYEETKEFPKHELYGLSSQMRRSAVSIISNIAEGAARQGKREFVNFLHIALGSASELEAQLELASRLGYVADARVQMIMHKRDRVAQMIFGLIRKLK